MHNCAISDTVEQKTDVIQGSKCGPLFYDTYSNDMSYLLTDDEKFSYADDTCQLFDVLTVLINTTVAKVLEWCKFDKLALNPSKFVHM